MNVGPSESNVDVSEAHLTDTSDGTSDFRQVPTDLLKCSGRRVDFHRWKAAAAIQACRPLRRILPPTSTAAGILMYHRVVPTDCWPADVAAPTWNVTPNRFRQQLAGLLKRGYQAWPLSRLIRESVNGHSLPPKVFCVTFDDGYANNFKYALPVLEQLQVPATIFVATGYLDSIDPFPFDDWVHKGSRLVDPICWRALTLEQCRLLQRSPLVELGSHTHTHEDFRNRPTSFATNLQLSVDFLRRRLSIKQPTLSLPYGIVREGFAGPTYYETARQMGLSCCLTTEEEVVDGNRSPFGWGRFIAEQNDSAGTLSVKLDGWRDRMRNIWRRLRGRSLSSSSLIDVPQPMPHPAG